MKLGRLTAAAAFAIGCFWSSAAVATVKRWRYEPAVYKGQPITVYRVVRIPFKLRA